MIRALALTLALAACAAPASASASEWHTLPVAGHLAALLQSADWSHPLPATRRAIVVVHGLGRDAPGYFDAAIRARDAAGPAERDDLVIAPWFESERDRREQALPDSTLAWPGSGWEIDGPSAGPDAVASFAVIDAILAKLADRTLFPALTEIVLVGHSGGAQLTQRYALIGHADATLAAAGVTLRYVVANPSSYAWLDDDRPNPATPAACPRALDWKYGLHALPPAATERDPATLARAFARRPVTYLLGTLDTDPNHPELDKTCMAETQGPTRFARGHNFYAALKAHFPETPQTLYEVPGVAHQGGRMITSTCGIAVIFRNEACR